MNILCKLAAACMIYEKDVTLSDMSKTFGMGGARIGWIITQNKDLYNEILKHKYYTTVCASGASELLTIMAIEKKENWQSIVDNSANIVNKNKRLVYNFIYNLKNNDLFEWTQGNRDNNINNNNNNDRSSSSVSSSAAAARSKKNVVSVPFGGVTMFIRLKGKAKEIGDDKFCQQVLNGCGILLAPARMFGESNKNCNYKSNDCFVRFGLGKLSVEKSLNILHEFLKTWRKNVYTKHSFVSKL